MIPAVTRRRPHLTVAASEAVAELARLHGEVAELSAAARKLLTEMEAIDAAAAEATGEAMRWLRDRELALSRRGGVGREEWDRQMAAADQAAAAWWRRQMAARGFGEAEAPALH